MKEGCERTGSVRDDLRGVADLILEIENRAQRLLEEARGIQAVERNARRILASTRLLKLNICEPLEVS